MRTGFLGREIGRSWVPSLLIARTRRVIRILKESLPGGYFPSIEVHRPPQGMRVTVTYRVEHHLGIQVVPFVFSITLPDGKGCLTRGSTGPSGREVTLCDLPGVDWWGPEGDHSLNYLLGCYRKGRGDLPPGTIEVSPLLDILYMSLPALSMYCWHSPEAHWTTLAHDDKSQWHFGEVLPWSCCVCEPGGKLALTVYFSHPGDSYAWVTVVNPLFEDILRDPGKRQSLTDRIESAAYALLARDLSIIPRDEPLFPLEP